MSILSRFAVVAVAASAVSSAGAVDLLFHQSFEVCWSSAYTKPQFLDVLRTSIEGTTACIPQQSGSTSGIPYTVCATPNGCGNGVPGCPVVMHSGAFSGDFVVGTFQASGSVDNIPIPINAGISCTLTLSAIVMHFDLDYLMRLDGSAGVYSDDLAAPVATISSYNRSGCALIADLIAPYVATAIVNAQEAASAAIEPALRTNSVERTICPLSP